MYIHINLLHKRKFMELSEKERAIGSPDHDEVAEEIALEI
jgi:hypothetical protein